MANPAFREDTLRKVFERSPAIPMSIEGAINKSGLLLATAVGGGALGWLSGNLLVGLIALIAGLILSFIIIRNPAKAPTLAPIYAVVEGYILGVISSMYHVSAPGIVSNAMLLTISALVLMLVLYRTKIIQVTEKFRSVMMIATAAIAVTYLVDLVLVLFGTEMPLIHQASPLGIGFSLIMVGVASFSLLMDFDMIEKAYNNKAPKYFEWYCGFALLVTLVWIYLEALRLLNKLNRK